MIIWNLRQRKIARTLSIYETFTYKIPDDYEVFIFNCKESEGDSKSLRISRSTLYQCMRPHVPSLVALD